MKDVTDDDYCNQLFLCGVIGLCDKYIPFGGIEFRSYFKSHDNLLYLESCPDSYKDKSHL